MTEPVPIACDLTKLSPQERIREKELLALFKRSVRGSVETEGGIRYAVAADPATLAAVGELFGLERLCCPFLAFELQVSTQEEASVHLYGGAGVKEFVALEFGR